MPLISTTRLREPPVRLHRGAHSPGAGKPAAQQSRPALASPIRFGHAGYVSASWWVGAEEKSPSLRRTAEDGLIPGLARLLSARAASSFLLGLVSAAAAAATTLGAARALAAPAGGARRVRDRRRARLIHSFLPQTFVLLVVLDTWVHDLLPLCAPLNGLPRIPSSTGENSPAGRARNRYRPRSVEPAVSPRCLAW